MNEDKNNREPSPASHMWYHFSSAIQEFMKVVSVFLNGSDM